MRRLLVPPLIALVLGAAPAQAVAQRVQTRPAPGRPRPPASAEPRALETTTDLRAHFGLDLVERLLRSDDPDNRLRGILRAATLGTPEAVARLIDIAEPSSTVRLDARALIEVARALAPSADKPATRAALVNLVNTPNPSASRSARTDDASSAFDADQVARLEMARGTAALALAQSGDAHAEEALFGILRAGGVGQKAAMTALAARPARNAALVGPSLVTPATIRLAVRTGDLRALDALRQAARSMDPVTRAAGLSALGEMGDGRGAELARAALGDVDARVRAAAARALVLLDAPERFRAVKALIDDTSTLAQGIELARTAQDDGVERALIARANAPIDADLRRAAVAALGYAHSPQALAALAGWLRNPLLSGDAAHALGRSPMRGAQATLDKALSDPATRRLGVRGALVRALVRGEKSSVFARTIEQLAQSREGADRALGVFARLAVGEGSLEKELGDPDARVRRSAALASLAGAERNAAAKVLARFTVERDPLTRTALLAGLVSGDQAGQVTTLELRARAEGQEADAPLAALALAQRGDTKEDANVNALLKSTDPLLRAHAARGLGGSPVPDAVGRLAAAYRYEPDATVRYALVLALASRMGQDRDAPARRETLKAAARLDPDDGVRWLAARALEGVPPPLEAAPADVTWLRATTADGGKPPPDLLGTLVRADGIAIPIVFDVDGYALVPGVPPGTARLILAPRVPAYDPAKP
ncbi:HEAT repeat domain-containing protein [Pendulispora brunnea]|uniref:HEAT repeat domain-containing protein n=1 Tax=Pendulispora brunnea TaxID=2905690 RepID=A0ABZ2K7X0_9BACT